MLKDMKELKPKPKQLYFINNTNINLNNEQFEPLNLKLDTYLTTGLTVNNMNN